MKVAVLDDKKEDARQLEEYLQRFQKETNRSFRVDVYLASFDFLEDYHSQYDVIFLDIEMPGSDGLEVAREIRARDSSVGIIFVTNMAQYAIHGYEVDAIDFMVKPVGYFLFAEKLEKAIRFSRRRERYDFLIHHEDGLHRVSMADVLYIQKDKDNLLYHTFQGVFRERGSIRTMKEKLIELPFAECNAGCLVNLEKVRRIGKETVMVEHVEVPLSRRMKKQFTQKYIAYIGGGF